MTGTLETGFPAQAAFLGVLMLSSLLALFYLMPVVVRGFFAAPPGGAGGGLAKVAEAPFLCVLPLVLTALLSLALFFAAPDLVELLTF